jgi:hypothetical protein
MKSIYKTGTMMAFGMSLFIFTSSTAQEFKTNESIINQLKKGTVPGLKFSHVIPNVQKVQVEDKKDPQYTKGNFELYLEKGFQGPVASGGGTAKTAIVLQTPKSKAVQLPSDARAETPAADQKP